MTSGFISPVLGSAALETTSSMLSIGSCWHFDDLESGFLIQSPLGKVLRLSDGSAKIDQRG